MSGAGMSFVGADHRQQLDREAPRQALHLVERHLPRGAADAALGAAVRKAQERALPGHPHRQRGALPECDVRVVAHAALRRPEHARVQNAVAGEDDPAPVVQVDGDADHDRALGIAETLGGGSVHVGVRERLLELRNGGAEERRVPLERLLLDRDLVDPGHESESISGGLEASVPKRSRRRPARLRRRRRDRPRPRARPRPEPFLRAGSRSRRPPPRRREPPPRSWDAACAKAGPRTPLRRSRSRAPPGSAATPQPVGSQKTATKMATRRAMRERSGPTSRSGRGRRARSPRG